MQKIVLTGPESTGKTTLARALAAALNGVFVPEFARTYLAATDGKYTAADLPKIAAGQAEAEINARFGESNYLICDTSFLVLKVWSEYKYGAVSDLISTFLQEKPADFYLLCGTDIPWEADPLRENPNEREELYDIYKKELRALRVPYLEVKGSLEKRVEAAKDFILRTGKNQNTLRKIYDSQTFRAQGHALVDALADRLEQTQNAEILPNNYHAPPDELTFWENYAMPAGDWQHFVNTVLDRSIRVHHPRYVGHQVAVPMPLSALAGLTSNFLNNGMAIYEMGTAASALEKIVLRTFCRAAGYGEEADGVLTSGGTLANLTALLAARKACAPTDVWTTGQGQKLAIMVSEQAHYCVDRAARIMGLGSEGIIKVPADNDFKMRTDLLPALWEKAENEGFKVIACVGSACTTATGTYDDLKAIADFCAAKKVWFHTDGAHGAAVIFSEKYRHLVNGIERADSIALDGHKMLGASALLTVLMYKNAKDSYAVFHQKAQYLWADADAPEWFNYGKRTFECTKSMMSLKLYSVLKMYGEQAFRALTEQTYDLARKFAADIRAHANFDLATYPESNIVCFRLKDTEKREEELNALNRKIRQQMLEEGEFYFVQTELNGKVWLRTTLMNPFTRREDLRELLQKIAEKGK